MPHKHKKQTYYLKTTEFINNLVTIPTSNISQPSDVTASSYIAGLSDLYCKKTNKKVGTCSASFLGLQREMVYVDIANYISLNNGLIITWLTPTTCANLEVDSMVNSLVSECIVTSTTKIGFNPYYGDTFDLKVSSDEDKIWFKFTLKCKR